MLKRRWPRGGADRPDRPDAGSGAAMATVGVALRRMRILAAGLVFMQVLARRPEGLDELGAWGLPLLGLGVFAVAGLVNLVSIVATRTENARLAALLGALELIADSALVLAIVSGAHGSNREVTWAILVVPVLEGALRYRLRGAIITWAGIGVAYFAMELMVFSAAPAFEAQFLTQLQTIIHRLGVVLLVAIPSGYLSEQLITDISAQRRATRAASDRGELLETVARVTEQVTRLDVQVLEAVTNSATALGFDAADVCELTDDGWVVVATSGGAILPAPDGAAGAAGEAARAGATMLVQRDTETPRELEALTAVGLEAIVVSPFGGDEATVLRAAVEQGTLTAPQVECLELLANQGGVALRNGRLVGELRDMQRQLEHLAFHDTLTGLANRARFSHRVQEAVTNQPDGGPVAVLFLDLDRFKNVNDSLGHEVGDELLVAVAGRLQGCVREGDLVCRLGGDEFTVLMHGVDDESEATTIAQRICDAMTAPFALSGHELRVSTSIGIAMVDRPGAEPTELVRQADVAMYRAKELGRSRWQRYSTDIDQEWATRIQLEGDLRLALEREDLHLVYQPIVAVAGGTVVGVEALVRWNHPELGPVPPDTFVSLAEDLGLADMLGRWVFDTVCAHTRSWQLRGAGQPPTVAVNLSPQQLLHPEFFQYLDDVVQRSAIDPAGILLEITEQIVGVGDDCEDLLDRLRARGFRLALDDFGQGQTSLRYLRRFDLDVLKIDKTFVHRGIEDPAEGAILRAIVGLAHDLGLSVIAEGVETVEQFHMLRRLGCDLAQGFGLHRPLPEHRVTEVLGAAVTAIDDAVLGSVPVRSHGLDPREG